MSSSRRPGKFPARPPGARSARRPVRRPAPPPANASSPRRPASGRGQPPAKGGDLRLRILTGLALGALAAGLLWAGAAFFFALAVVVVAIAQSELYRAARSAGHNPAAGLGLAAGLVLLVGVFLQGEGAAAIVLTATLAATFLWYLTLENRSSLVTNVAITVMGVAYVPLLGSYIGLLAAREADGRGVTIVALGAAAVYDIFAFAGGRKLGRHKLAPSISPNKTWEGAIVATVATVATMALAAPRLGPWTLGQAALLGAAISIAAPLGDLVESAIKRDLRVKDMGTILPGHGGALDRIDAILFCAPTVYLSLRLFGH